MLAWLVGQLMGWAEALGEHTWDGEAGVGQGNRNQNVGGLISHHDG